MSVIYGFGGMMIKEGLLSFEPHLPANWKALSFKVLYRDRILEVHIDKERASIENPSGDDVELYLSGRKLLLERSGTVVADL